MYIFLIIIHVIVCLVLIAVILLQAGRGGGFSDLAGGNSTQSIFGTQTNAFMTRATEVCAIVFILTSLTLGIMSTQKGKSLMEKQRLMDSVKTSLPAAQVTGSVKPVAETVKAEAAPVAAATAAAISAPSQEKKN